MAEFPYKKGDNWFHEEANEVVGDIRRIANQQPSSDQEITVKIAPHVALPAYSVFGVGSSDAVTFDPDPAIKTKDPLDTSVPPYYTNGGDPWVITQPRLGTPVGTKAVKLRLDGAVAPGERAKPDAQGRAVKSASGQLLCVTDTDTGHAMFVFSALSQTMFIGKPDADVAAGASGTVSIWRNGTDTGEDQADVHLDWMHGGEKISAGKETVFVWFEDEGLFRFTNSECEDKAPEVVEFA